MEVEYIETVLPFRDNTVMGLGRTFSGSVETKGSRPKQIPQLQ